MPRRLTGKYCWVAKPHTKRWRLGFYFHCEPVSWLPFWFNSREDVAKALGTHCVYIDTPPTGEDHL